jgi:hypothetical protein
VETVAHPKTIPDESCPVPKQTAPAPTNAVVSPAATKGNCILDLMDAGRRVGDVCLTSKDTVFNANQRFIKGSGYIQAVKGHFHNVIVNMKYRKQGAKDESINQIAIGINRIDWDEDGRTIRLTGVRPYIEDWFGAKLSVHGDLETPPLADGIVTLEIEKIGKIPIDIRFGGKGVSNTPGFPQVSSTIVCDKVFEY